MWIKGKLSEITLIQKKETKGGVGEMAQSIKYLLYKHESLSLHLRHPSKSGAHGSTAETPALWKWVIQEDSGSSLDSQASQISAFQFSERPCL